LRIDSHQHFWKFDPVRDSWINDDMEIIRRDFLPNDLSVEISKAGIDGTIAVQADESETETHFLLELAAENDFIKGVVGWVDLKHELVDLQLHEWKKYPKLKGFRSIIQGRPDDFYFKNKAFQQGMRYLTRHQFTYDLLIYHDQLPAAIQFMEKFPDQAFILDHLGKPGIKAGEIKKWKENIRIMAQHPRTFCKLSGLATEADWKKWRYEDLSPYLEIAGEYFGVDRLCFGSDWPVCLLAGSYGKVTEIITRFLQQVEPADRDKIWGANAANFYQII
jgi:L-fuconolactonase